MGILDLFASKPSGKAYTFKNAGSFTGFKKSSLSCRYGQAPKNAAKFVGKDLTGHSIRFNRDKTTDGRPMLAVYLSNVLIGHVWSDTNTYERITKGWVEEVCVVVAPGPDVNLYVKLREGAK